MDYIAGNKEAWEEAFENRDGAWGSDIVERIKNERLPFFEKDMAAVLEKRRLEGKTIGQFCSNNGRELLSLMQSGAQEGIGFDIAENQVKFANKTAKILGHNCRFIAANILDIGKEYYDRFDLIIITIGALCWFKDLGAFFDKVYRCLKKGGCVIINEQHPLTNMFAVSGEDNYKKELPADLVNSYFHKEWKDNDGMYYMTKKSYKSKTFTDYTHPFAEIVGAICGSGLNISSLREFEYDISGMFGGLDHRGIPLSYILEAKKNL